MPDDLIPSKIDTTDLDPICNRLRTGVKENSNMPRVRKTPLADFKRDTDLVNTLIQGGWAKRGCISMHVSTTGTGKSVLQTQSALSFHQGIECCGLKPTHPFTMWIVQSEDDDDRIAFDRDCVVERLAKDHPKADWNQAMKDILFLNFTGITGSEFIKELDNVLSHRESDITMPDGIIINPLNAYFGGNIRESCDASAFFKGGLLRHKETEGLEAVLKRHNIWAWLFAHTPKPPGSKELYKWLNGEFMEYSMCGASEIADAVRSVITFLKVPGRDGVFAFTAGKNGKGLGWTDAAGAATNRAFYRWSQSGDHFWEHVPDEEYPTIGQSRGATPQKQPPPPPKDEMPILEQAFKTQTLPITKGLAVKLVQEAVNDERRKIDPLMKPIGRNDSTALVDLAISRSIIQAIEYKGKKGTLCALPSVMAEYQKEQQSNLAACQAIPRNDTQP